VIRPSAVAGRQTIYVLGMFAVTMVLNVPLNDALAAADPSSSEGAALWARYLKDWDLLESPSHDRFACSVRAVHDRNRGKIGQPSVDETDNYVSAGVL
jgi:uncharacterized membrane protein